ncbi:glycosyltransferase family 39 protein [Winogradskyella sp. SM1960]|uniref:glycosyltransferase family 39 protein n=1 Tax=Winogradskyella sp. SM1960 TaxID=2865955 RepID=UPI001CD69E9B|nr:glycosyltransferase family 39 protein [Winogradskyella sp. SM1960]
MKLLKKLSNLYNNYTLSTNIGFIAIVMLLLALQGFDVVDEGWYMTFYQQFFNHPETVEYNFVFYLTGVIGGVWYELFPQGGILSFRVLALFCIVLTFVFSYKILIQYMSKHCVVIGLLMVLFVNDFGYVAFYYNQLSSLIAILTIYFLLRGLDRNSIIYIILAGFLTAINVFSRLPNLTLFAFSLVFPAQLLWNKYVGFKYWFKQTIMYGIGAVIGFLIMYLIISSFGHLEIMQNSILNILDKGQNTGSNHNFSKLLNVYFAEYRLILKVFLKILAASVVIVLAKNLLFKNIIGVYLWYTMAILLFIFVFRDNSIYTLYALSLIGSLSLLMFKTVTSDYKLLSLLALIMMLFLPLGSDGGIHNVGYVCIWVALPLFFYVINHSDELYFKWINKKIQPNSLISKKMLLSVLPLMVVGYFAYKVYKISNESYFDFGSRFDKVYAIDNKLANGVYTTKERAEIFNELLSVLKKYVSKNDYLLAYDKIPMVNFLTETKPYMYISWVWVYDGVMFKKQLERAETEIDILPIVVQQKFETIGQFSTPDPYYMSESKEEDYRYNRNRVKAMNDFLERNNYKIVWSNDYFNIYQSN